MERSSQYQWVLLSSRSCTKQCITSFASGIGRVHSFTIFHNDQSWTMVLYARLSFPSITFHIRHNRGRSSKDRSRSSFIFIRFFAEIVHSFQETVINPSYSSRLFESFRTVSAQPAAFSILTRMFFSMFISSPPHFYRYLHSVLQCCTNHETECCQQRMPADAHRYPPPL